jgi:hypothetical protein
MIKYQIVCAIYDSQIGPVLLTVSGIFVRTLETESEAEVRERLVGFGHAVNFVTLFHGAATAFVGL